MENKLPDKEVSPSANNLTQPEVISGNIEVKKSGSKIIPLILVSILILVIVILGIHYWVKFQGTAPEKVYRVGVLSGLNYFADTTDGFKAKMTELGYIEGKNIVYDVQKTDFDMAAYKRILKIFVDNKVDLIFVFPTEASQEAKDTTKESNIPVVFANAFTEDTGLVNSVREPGGNITGVRWAGPDLALQRFEIMHELVPQAKRLWIPYQKGYPIVKSQLEALRSAAAVAGLMLSELPADNATELDTQLQQQATLFNKDTDVILLLAEPLGVTPDAFAVIGKFGNLNKIPVGGALMSTGEYESIFGLTPQSVPQGKQAAFLADKILKGANPGTIPVVSAEGFFQLNYREAKKLGLSVSEGLLSRADEIIR